MIHPPETLRRQVEALKQLPTISPVMQRIMTVVTDPDSNAPNLAREIEMDQSLTAKILRMVNSAFYGFYRQISSVEDAVVILGYNEIRILALTVSVFETVGVGNSPWDRPKFWEHSLAVAFGSETLAEVSGMDPKEAYVAGLLHDIGKVAIDRVLGHDWFNVIRISQQKKLPLPEVEMEMLGLTHSNAGWLLAERWHLPIGISAAISDHHAPVNGKPGAPVAALVHVANLFVKEQGIGDSGNPDRGEILPWVQELFGLGEKEKDLVMEKTAAKSRAIDAVLHYLAG